MLDESGLGYLWTDQISIMENKAYYTSLFEGRLQDIMLQKYSNEMASVSDNRLYKHLDHDFYGKDYLRTIKSNHLRTALTKMRLGSHNFNVERGRWTRPCTEYTHRLCKECDMLEDEFHIFFECDRYISLRKKYLPPNIQKNPSMFKFISFLHKSDGKMLSN